MKVGVVGAGFVGQATSLLACAKIEILAYDKDPAKCSDGVKCARDLAGCRLIFVAVPTPSNADSSVDLRIVESVVLDIRRELGDDPMIVIRSTVPPGTSDRLGCFFMPEFLTEKNWRLDFKACRHWVFGEPASASLASKRQFQSAVQDVFGAAFESGCIDHQELHFVDAKSAEAVKYFRNCFLALKVGFANEMAKYCSAAGIDYSATSALTGLDPRIGPAHLSVPGPDGKCGYGGTCFPKDTHGLCTEMERFGVEPVVLRALIDRNERLDRPAGDWKSNIGRAVSTRPRPAIVVAGGCGFIGAHLCRSLLKEREDHLIVCVDNLRTGRVQNVDDLREDPRFIFVRRDVRDPLRLGLISVEEVYNLACAASPPRYQVDPIGTTETCFTGTHNLLALARDNGAKFLQASTSEVYGDPVVSPQPESYLGNVSCTGPRSCYDEGKRVAESLAFDFKRKGSDVRVARIFNTYGPGMDPYDGHVVSTLLRQARAGEPLTVHGDGKQTCSFCYVGDLVAALRLLMELSAAPSGPVSLGSDHEITIMELAEVVKEVAGAPDLKVQFEPRPADDPCRRRPDTTLAKSLLGWEPRVPLREGLTRMLREDNSSSDE